MEKEARLVETLIRTNGDKTWTENIRGGSDYH